MMREAHLARTRNATSADETSGGNRMMWSAERPGAEARSRRRQQTRDGMNCGDLEGFVLGQWRENRWQPPREHRLARARGTDEQTRMRARGRDLERALGARLSDDVGEVGIVGVLAGATAW